MIDASDSNCAREDFEASGVFGFSLGLSEYREEDKAREVVVAVEPGDLSAQHGFTIQRTDATGLEAVTDSQHTAIFPSTLSLCAYEWTRRPVCGFMGAAGSTL
jgi:hypothetical protein